MVWGETLLKFAVFGHGVIVRKLFGNSFQIALSTAILTAIQTQLVNGLPMEFGFEVAESYGQAEKTGAFPYPSEEESFVGGHAVLAIGYDDAKRITNTTTGMISQPKA